jgi:hypothetical protein
MTLSYAKDRGRNVDPAAELYLSLRCAKMTLDMYECRACYVDGAMRHSSALLAIGLNHRARCRPYRSPSPTAATARRGGRQHCIRHDSVAIHVDLNAPGSAACDYPAWDSDFFCMTL